MNNKVTWHINANSRLNFKEAEQMTDEELAEIQRADKSGADIAAGERMRRFRTGNTDWDKKVKKRNLEKVEQEIDALYRKEILNE